MSSPIPKLLTFTLAAVIALGTLDAAQAKTRKRVPRATSPDITSDLTMTRGQLVPTDKNGTPIIMQGYRSPDVLPEPAPAQRADRPVRVPRGSSTYIPPVNPAPNSYNSPPAASLTQMPPAPYQPPKITTFGDRVNDAIHAYPLERGIGNNPVDQQMFIRQRANQ